MITVEAAARAVDPPPFLGLAGHPIRWRLLSELARSDRPVRELTALVGEPQNLVSYHLEPWGAGRWSRCGAALPTAASYYLVDLERYRDLVHAAGTHCIRGSGPRHPSGTRRSGRASRVLFLCTGNSARSQIAEALLEHLSDGRSASSSPEDGGGTVFFVLTIINANLRSGSPSATDPGDEIIDYLASHDGQIQAAAVLMGLAMPAALLWLSGLFRTLRKAEGGTPGIATLAALEGGVLAAASTVTGALVAGTMANRIDVLGPADARVWWTMYLLSTGATLLGLLLIGATAAVCLRTRLFARWFSVASVVLALASLVGACTIGYDADGIQAVAGIAVLLDTVWIVLVSFYLWRDPELALP